MLDVHQFTRAVNMLLLHHMPNVLVPQWALDLAANRSSDQAKENYVMMGMAPPMKRWISERPVSGLLEQKFEIANEPYSTGIFLTREDYRRLKDPNQWTERVQDLARRAVELDYIEIVNLLLNGETTPCYDEQPLFSTDHVSNRSGTQSNLLSLTGAGGASPTALQMANAIDEAIASIREWKDDQGEYTNETAGMFRIIVPHRLGIEARTAVGASTVQGTGGAIDNLLKFNDVEMGVASTPRFSQWVDTDNNTSSFLVQSLGTPRPLIVQDETGIETAVIDERETTRKITFTAYKSAGYGPGEWRSLCKVNLAA